MAGRLFNSVSTGSSVAIASEVLGIELQVGMVAKWDHTHVAGRVTVADGDTVTGSVCDNNAIVVEVHSANMCKELWY